MKKTRCQSLRFLTVSTLLCLCPSSSHAEKLLEFRFNKPGTFAPSSPDALSPLVLSLKNPEGNLVDLHGQKGSGVSGKSGDRAFDCTSATGMGKVSDKLPQPAPATYIGPVAIAEDETSLLSGLKSYTIQGWFKTDGSVITGVARLVHFANAQDSAGKTVIDLAGNLNGGTLFLGITTPTATRKEPVDTKAFYNAYDMVNQWVFFALTYRKNEFSFYVGDAVNTAALAGVSKGDGATGDVPTILSIGNTQTPKRPFKGWIDNIRIYGSADEEKGALSISDLEMLRKLDASGL